MIVELEAWRATQVVFALKLDGPDVTDNVSRQALRSVGNRKAWVSLVCIEASPSGECRSPMCVNVLERDASMRCGRINALRTGLGLRGPSSAIPDREALRLRTVPRRAPMSGCGSQKQNHA